MPTFEEVDFAMRGMPIVIVAAIVTVLAYALQRRAMAIFGIVGILLASFVPEPLAYVTYRSVEAAAMGAYNAAFFHSLICSSVGALIGAITGFYAGKIARQSS